MILVTIINEMKKPLNSFNWRQSVVTTGTSLRDAMICMDASGMQLALVTDSSGRLRGILTDGDVRRAIINKKDIDESVDKFMIRNPLTRPVGTPPSLALSVMRRESVHHLPIVTPEGILSDVYFIDDLIGRERYTNPVVIMAGGEGKRLRPLTENCPKPMLTVGGIPILERILNRFILQGYERFFISVNYRAELIKDYFGCGSKWEVSISYIHEEKPLGTAGSLSLLPFDQSDPIIVMNGDVLTDINFPELVDAHESTGSKATMAVREYLIEIPFGVIDQREGVILSLREKPTETFLVNTGVYVLDPEVLKSIPKGYIDMTTLFASLVNNGLAFAHKVDDSWFDVGRLEDLEAVRALPQFSVM